MTKGKATQQWALGGIYDTTCAMLGAHYAGVNDRLNPINNRQHKRAITRIAPTLGQRRRIKKEGNCSTNRQSRPTYERESRQPGQSHRRLSPRQDSALRQAGQVQ